MRQVASGLAPKSVSEANGVCVKAVRKWAARFQAKEEAGLRNRWSRPQALYRPITSTTMAAIEALRRQSSTGLRIARKLGVSPATVSRVLRRLGLRRIAAL